MWTIVVKVLCAVVGLYVASKGIRESRKVTQARLERQIIERYYIPSSRANWPALYKPKLSDHLKRNKARFFFHFAIGVCICSWAVIPWEL